MAQDKQLSRLEAKIDALLEKSGLDPADFGETGGKAPAQPVRALTPAQQEAINNAPKHIEARPVDQGAQPVPATPPTPPPPPATPPIPPANPLEPPAAPSKSKAT